MPRTSSGINYHRCGQGEPLLLVHGIGHHWQGWAPQIELLEREFELIVPDLPGFGASATLVTGVRPSIPNLARALGALLGEIGVERPHVAGNSLGGAIALEMGRLDLVRSVNAISPSGFWSEAEHRYATATLKVFGGTPRRLRPMVKRALGTAAGRTVLLSLIFARPWRLPALEARSMLADFWAAPGWEATLAATGGYSFAGGDELEVPVTVSWGSRDALLLYRPQSRRARERLPDAAHITLHGLGHTPFADDPEQVVDAIRAATLRSQSI